MVIDTTTITPRPPHPMDDAAEAHGRPEDAGVAKNGRFELDLAWKMEANRTKEP
jgi:hypothetical protein